MSEILRQSQSIEELQRKAIKARRKDIFTQEDIDYAKERARQTLHGFKAIEAKEEYLKTWTADKLITPTGLK